MSIFLFEVPFGGGTLARAVGLSLSVTRCHVGICRVEAHLETAHGIADRSKNGPLRFGEVCARHNLI
jgi:hypothetical protein